MTEPARPPDQHHNIKALSRRVAELEAKLGHSQDSHDAMFRRAEAEYKRAEQAEQQLADNPASLGREGMVTVWDHHGSYVGCLGTVAWALLLSGLDILALSRRVAELEAENRDFRDEIVREHNALCAAEREANKYRIEADCLLRDVDGLELDVGIAVEALEQIATPRPNERFDPWARDVAAKALASVLSRPEEDTPDE